MTEREIDTASGPARVEVERPTSPVGVLVLGHGAGGGIEAPDIRLARDVALAHGLAVARVTQPYRVAGRKAPAPAPRLDEAWLAVVAELRRRRGWRSLPFVVGGRSSGARVACRTAGAAGAVGVLCLAFPLHPPGRPEAGRLPELEQPSVPVLVIQGDRDPFGLPPAGPGRTVVVLEGADHGLRKGAPQLREAVAAFLPAVVPGADLRG